jgi:hypothetical protein
VQATTKSTPTSERHVQLELQPVRMWNERLGRPFALGDRAFPKENPIPIKWGNWLASTSSRYPAVQPPDFDLVLRILNVGAKGAETGSS